MMKEGQANEAVKELETLSRRADGQLQLPVKIALLHAHRGAQFRYSSNMWKVAKAAGLDPMIAF